MSYIPVSNDSHFSIKNIPFGIFSPKGDSRPRPATAIGEYVLDLSVLAKEGAFSKVSGFDSSTLQQVTNLLCTPHLLAANFKCLCGIWQEDCFCRTLNYH